MRSRSRSPRQPARFAEEAQQLDRRHVEIERTVLRQVADAAPRPRADRAARRIPTMLAVPLARREVAGQHPHDRRLAGAVRAEQRDDLAVRNVERDLVDGDERAVVLTELVRFDDRARTIGGVHRPGPING